MAEIEPTPENIRQTALGLLGRREHGRLELRRKLQRRFGAVPALDPVLDALEQDGYLSDRRFAESMTRMRSGRGYGPLRVRAELSAKGVAGATAAQVMEEQAADWVALAVSALHKRFGATNNAATNGSDTNDSATNKTDTNSSGNNRNGADPVLRGKQYRFLAQRGFNAEQIRAALAAYEGSGANEDESGSP